MTNSLCRVKNPRVQRLPTLSLWRPNPEEAECPCQRDGARRAARAAAAAWSQGWGSRLSYCGAGRQPATPRSWRRSSWRAPERQRGSPAPPSSSWWCPSSSRWTASSSSTSSSSNRPASSAPHPSPQSEPRTTTLVPLFNLICESGFDMVVYF